MRFFSNENKDSDQNREPDADSTVQTRAEHLSADTTQAVPLQRTGSPWSAAPGDTDADAELAAQERSDGTDEPGYAGEHGTDQPVDVPLDDQDRTPADDSSVATAPVDEQNRVDEGEQVEPTSTTTTYGPDGTAATSDATNRDIADNKEIIESDVADTGSGAVGTSSGAALKDDGGFDDPRAVDPATDQPLEGAAADSYASDTEAADSSGAGSAGGGSAGAGSATAGLDGTGATLRDEGGFDDPQAVDPATDRPL